MSGNTDPSRMQFKNIDENPIDLWSIEAVQNAIFIIGLIRTLSSNEEYQHLMQSDDLRVKVIFNDMDMLKLHEYVRNEQNWKWSLLKRIKRHLWMNRVDPTNPSNSIIREDTEPAAMEIYNLLRNPKYFSDYDNEFLDNIAAENFENLISTPHLEVIDYAEYLITKLLNLLSQQSKDIVRHLHESQQEQSLRESKSILIRIKEKGIQIGVNINSTSSRTTDKFLEAVQGILTPYTTLNLSIALSATTEENNIMRYFKRLVIHIPPHDIKI